MRRRAGTRGIAGIGVLIVAAVTIATAVPASAGTSKGRRSRAKAAVERVEQRRRACFEDAGRRQWVLGVVKAKIGQADFLTDDQKAALEAGVDSTAARVRWTQFGIAFGTPAQLDKLCAGFAVDRVIMFVYLPQLVYADKLAEANKMFAKAQALLAAKRDAGVDTSEADAALADMKTRADRIIAALVAVTPESIESPAALVALWTSVKVDVDAAIHDVVSVVRLLRGS